MAFEAKAQHPHQRALRLKKLCVYTFAFLAALPFARLAAQAFSSAFLQAAVILLLGFCAGLADGAVPLIFAHLAF
jgi:hypothetical protein